MIDVTTRIAGRYRVDARLGGGGMADVYDGYDEVLDRPVAIKLLRGIDEAGAARRFAEEIRLTARVNHPNIVSLYDAGEHDGSPFLVLERVTGGTLAGEMAAGPMAPARVAAMGEQLASALSHSHAAGIVHRDVKPTNILLTSDGSVRLADFGIAVTATATRLTVTGTIAGSAGYVSPEQVLGSGAGAPSDVYALGLVLLECLTGAPPWSGTTVEVALARISSDPYLPPDLPEDWATLLRAMTAREPDERPSIDLVGHALSKLAVDETFDQSLFPAPAPAPDRRIPVVAAMSMIVLLASAFMTLTSNVTPDLAAAQSQSPPASVAAAPEPVLTPPVDKAVAPAPQDPSKTGDEVALVGLLAAQGVEDATASTRNGRTDAATAAAQDGGGENTGTGGSNDTSSPLADVDLELPDASGLTSNVGTSTSTNLPTNVKDNTAIRDTTDTVDTVTKDTTKTTTDTTTDAKGAESKVKGAEKAAEQKLRRQLRMKRLTTTSKTDTRVK